MFNNNSADFLRKKSYSKAFYKDKEEEMPSYAISMMEEKMEEFKGFRK